MNNIPGFALLLLMASCTNSKESEQKEKQETEIIESRVKTDEERMDSMEKALGIDTLMQDSLY